MCSKAQLIRLVCIGPFLEFFGSHITVYVFMASISPFLFAGKTLDPVELDMDVVSNLLHSYEAQVLLIQKMTRLASLMSCPS